MFILLLPTWINCTLGHFFFNCITKLEKIPCAWKFRVHNIGKQRLELNFFHWSGSGGRWLVLGRLDSSLFQKVGWHGGRVPRNKNNRFWEKQVNKVHKLNWGHRSCDHDKSWRFHSLWRSEWTGFYVCWKTKWVRCLSLRQSSLFKCDITRKYDLSSISRYWTGTLSNN